MLKSPTINRLFTLKKFSVIPTLMCNHVCKTSYTEIISKFRNRKAHLEPNQESVTDT